MSYQSSRCQRDRSESSLTIFDHCTVQHQKCQLCHFSWKRAEIFTTDPLPDLFQNTVVKFYYWVLTIYDHCATPKMPTLPFFMVESWNFHNRSLAWSFSIHNGQFIFKLTFDHFWPLCTIKNANFAILHPKKLKFLMNTFGKYWNCKQKLWNSTKIHKLTI